MTYPKLLSPGDVIGTWNTVRSEMPSPYRAAEEFIHFSAEGDCHWEFPFLKQENKLWRFIYEIVPGGMVLRAIGRQTGEYPMVNALREGERLVLKPAHGHSTWLERIPGPERPEYLSMFVEPPVV